MDFSILLTAPVIGAALFLVLVSAWVGYVMGKSGESKRGEQAMAKAAEAARAVLEKQRLQHESQVEKLAQEHGKERDKILQAHQQQLTKLNQAHQALVDSLREGHAVELQNLAEEQSALVERINAEQVANINELKENHQRQLEEFNDRYNSTIHELEERRQRELEQLRREADHKLQELQQEHRQMLDGLEKRHAEQVAELEKGREALQKRIVEMEALVSRMEQENQEARLKNLFSISKSGEKLVKVVRSVQELASELDETSRTVTGGEYSFLEEIKDQRDRETVLSLAAGAVIPTESSVEEEKGAPAGMEEDDTPDGDGKEPANKGHAGKSEQDQGEPES